MGSLLEEGHYWMQAVIFFSWQIVLMHQLKALEVATNCLLSDMSLTPTIVPEKENRQVLDLCTCYPSLDYFDIPLILPATAHQGHVTSMSQSRRDTLPDRP